MKVDIDSEQAMRKIGERIGRALKGGECIELIGDIGSGKTTLTKGIAAGLSIPDTVQSPTFTINRTYDSPSGLHLSHYDFYRLSEPGIMADELRETLTIPDTSVVIEWGDIVSPMLPNDCLSVTFSSPSETSRSLMFEAKGPKATALVKALA